MTKLKIYIDFEAISSPFSNRAKLPNNFPYAYTLGLYVGKKFKTRTFIFNFHNENTANVYDVFRNNIMSDIRQILKQNKFMVNQNTIKFVGWDPILEQKIIDHLFPNIEVVNLNSGRDVSLARITPEIEHNYFEYVRKLVAQNLSINFRSKRMMSSDGAIAAYVGYLLHAQIHNKKGQYVSNFDLRLLLKELRHYSKDDVLRMEFLQARPELFKARVEKAENLIYAKNKISRNITRTKTFVNKLVNFDQKMPIGKLIESLEKEIVDLEKDKTKLEDNFENF